MAGELTASNLFEVADTGVAFDLSAQVGKGPHIRPGGPGRYR